jgi:hypothetical protein
MQADENLKQMFRDNDTDYTAKKFPDVRDEVKEHEKFETQYSMYAKASEDFSEACENESNSRKDR